MLPKLETTDANQSERYTGEVSGAKRLGLEAGAVTYSRGVLAGSVLCSLWDAQRLLQACPPR
jgi:hypothetical protein